MVPDDEVEGHTASPDVWAAKSLEAKPSHLSGDSRLLFFEDKHVQPPAYLSEEQVQGLKYVAQRAGAAAIIAVKWKHTSGHAFAFPHDLDRTEAGTYVFREGQTKTYPLTDIIQP